MPISGAHLAAMKEPILTYAAFILLEIAVLIRVILRPHREPASRIAWVVVIAVVPFLGIVAYLLFGETNVGRRRAARARAIAARLPRAAPIPDDGREPALERVPENYRSLFRVGRSISGFDPVGGNQGRLSADSNETVASIVADIDAATDHVHLLFYIWLTDGNGTKVAEAVQRAASRGVTCRAMVDGLGSRAMIRSPLWRAMRDAGVRVAVALPIGNPLLRPFRGRIDLRDHRKIVVIDDHITWCGSQNCADPEFRVKAKYAPWVDAMLRFDGPIARQNQTLFLADWMTNVDEDASELLRRPLVTDGAGVPSQAIGTGPTARDSAMPEMFESLMFAARNELVITTPYYVPVDAMQGALRAAANRGVATTLVVPARNDSFVVAAASRSYYAELLACGIRIFEYAGGLLHTKSLTIDGCVTLLGSANMDRRSFDLNYENNVLFHDQELTADVRALQQRYIGRSREILPDEVAAWPATRRLWNNTIAMLGPLL